MRNALLIVFFLISAALADNPTETQDYKDAMAAFQQEKYIKVRNIAEARLKKDEQDALGLFLMTQVHLLLGNNPRAYLYSTRAQKAFEKILKDPTTSTEGDLKLHELALQLRFSSAMGIGKYEEAVQLVSIHDKLYKDEPLEASAGWPLLKLGRLEECKRRMKAVIEKEDIDNKIQAMNTLAALEWEQGNIQKSRDIFLELKETVVANNLELDAVILSNKAESEVGLGNFEVAIKDYREAAEYISRATPSSPYSELTKLFIDEAQFQKALEATRSMYYIDKQCIPEVRNQNRASLRLRFASLLLTTGYPDKASEILEQLLNRPDRNYGTSDAPYRLETEILLLYQDALYTGLQKLEEENSWSGFAHRLSGWPSRWQKSSKLNDARRRAACLIVDHEALSEAFLPYQADWVGSPWLLPSLIEALGPGVAGETVSTVLEESKNEYFVPFLKATLGETKVTQGDYEEAIEYLKSAEKDLPSHQVLLKTRVRANLAVALENTGEMKSALGYYQKVLETDPIMLRRLDLALPVKFEMEESSGAPEVRSMLLDSPRFRANEQGFTIELSESFGDLRARLLKTDGGILTWVNNRDEEQPVDLVKKFHESVFAPRLRLTDAEIAQIQNPTISK